MRQVLVFLSILGVVAVVLRLGRSLLRTLGRSAEGVAAGQAVDARAQRGDLTGMAEASEWRRVTTRNRWKALTTSGLWAAVLVVPAFTAWTLQIYAADALLWVVDLIARRVR